MDFVVGVTTSSREQNLMTEQELIQSVLECLNGLGLRADTLEPRKNRKTADISAVAEEETYVIEVKMRDRSEAVRGIISALDVGESALLEPEPIYFRNSLSSTITDGVEQLSDTVTTAADFRVLWFHASDDDPETDKFQIEGTLTGQAHLLDRAPNGSVVPCYYFYESRFHRHREELDGAIISYEDQLFFLLNNYSPRYERLKSSQLVTSLAAAAWDPVELERSGRILLADCETDRREVGDTLDYICAKYAKDFIVVELNRYSGVSRIS